MNKKQNKKFNRYATITMQTFLKDYVGITEQLNILKRASHKDIKQIGFQNVITIAFENVDNDNLAMGDILLVIDIQHHIAPYLNPLRIENRKITSKSNQLKRCKSKK